MANNPTTDAANATDRPPTDALVAGKYELGRLIGRGGMGSVWEGRHVSLGTRVAIKFVDVEQAKSQEARDRFQNEARAAASIQSKHAIKVHDHGLLEDGRPYIVMELLVGEPLDRRLDTVKRLPLETTARIVQQVARALQQAHDAGITHRDLKPENIFLEQGEADDEEFAKVLDFGIAKIRDPAVALSLSSGTKTGVLMGTPFYMSPEQARGLKTVDHRSDLWALAVIVFRCVTGVLPFDGQSLGDLLVKICTAPVPVPSQALPGCSPQLDGWMQRALGREPEERFQSAFEMAESLAMVAGISVRLPSRRSGDVFARGSTVVSGPGSSHVEPLGLTPSAPPPAHPASSVPEAFAAMRQPAGAVTSSPLTASAAPPGSSTGAIGTGALAVMAVLGLVAAAGGTAWLTHGRSDGAPRGPAGELMVSAAREARALPSSGATTGATPSATPLPAASTLQPGDAGAPWVESTAASSPAPTVPVATAHPGPGVGHVPAAGNGGARRTPLPPIPPLPATSQAKSAGRPAPTLPGSDPGF